VRLTPAALPTTVEAFANQCCGDATAPKRTQDTDRAESADPEHADADFEVCLREQRVGDDAVIDRGQHGDARYAFAP
jgi:hypothetical protein